VGQVAVVRRRGLNEQWYGRDQIEAHYRELLHAFPLAAVARLRGFSESFPEYGAP
jgi:hypothetical protein